MWFVVGLPATAAGWSSPVEATPSLAIMLGEGAWSSPPALVWSSSPRFLPRFVEGGVQHGVLLPPSPSLCPRVDALFTHITNSAGKKLLFKAP